MKTGLKISYQVYLPKQEITVLPSETKGSVILEITEQEKLSQSDKLIDISFN